MITRGKGRQELFASLIVFFFFLEIGKLRLWVVAEYDQPPGRHPLSSLGPSSSGFYMVCLLRHGPPAAQTAMCPQAAQLDGDTRRQGHDSGGAIVSREDRVMWVPKDGHVLLPRPATMFPHVAT